MSVSLTIRQAEDFYSKKQYNNAIQVLSTALTLPKLSTDHQLRLHDLRCQAYAKLGKRDLALQDAKFMIHMSNRRISTGYLRCSQIERVSGNYEAAMKWLEHGSKNVPALRETFEGQKVKVLALADKQLAIAKRQDPMTAVPLEVLEMILSYVTYREVVRLLMVSKAWKNVLLTIEPLITTVDFTNARRTVSSQACKAALKRLCKQPRILILVSLSSGASSIATTWLAKRPNLDNLEAFHLINTDVSFRPEQYVKLRKLRSLRIGRGQQLTLSTAAGVIASCQALQNILIECPRPERNHPFLHTGVAYTHLQHLCVHQAPSTSMVLFPTTMIEAYPNLQSLSIIGMTMSSGCIDLSKHCNLRKLHFESSSSLEAILQLKLPVSLEELNVTGDLRHLQLDIVEPINLTQLHTITLSSMRIISVMQRFKDSNNLPFLQTVVLQDTDWSNLSCILGGQTSIFHNVRDLSLASEDLHTSDTENFAAMFPALERLTLEAPRITGVFISDLVQLPGCKLTEVLFRDCVNVSVDIRDWLKIRNIRCRIINSGTDTRSGRRIRNDW